MHKGVDGIAKGSCKLPVDSLFMLVVKFAFHKAILLLLLLLLSEGNILRTLSNVSAHVFISFLLTESYAQTSLCLNCAVLSQYI